MNIFKVKDTRQQEKAEEGKLRRKETEEKQVGIYGT